MFSDNFGLDAYATAMEQGQPFIRLKLDTEQPVELGDFVGAFTAIASEYDRYVRRTRPDADPNATLFVREVRVGCIEADLIPWLTGGGALLLMSNANTLADFVKNYGGWLGRYVKKGGKLEDATSSQLKDFTAQVAAIANAPGSSLNVAAIEIKEGKQEVRAAFKFDTGEARAIREHVEDHRVEMEKRTDADHKRVLMQFTRSDIGNVKLGKRSGELVRIDAVGGSKRLPLIYASDLAEQRIKHEIKDAQDNVFKKGFVVDVNVEMAGERVIAYRVTHLHQVIDIPDDDVDE